jgi:plasmid maintenance system antidote protein VapI
MPNRNNKWADIVQLQLDQEERSRSWLAKKLDIDRSTFNKMIRGERNFPKDKQHLIAYTLNLSVKQIFDN